MERSNAALIELDDVACGYAKHSVLRGIGFAMAAGEFLCLLGPNGVGKTTLFKTILRLLPAQHGVIRIQGQDVAHWSPARFAAMVGYVPQAHVPPFPFTVLDVVAMGRAAHVGPFGSPSASDMGVAESMLEILSISHLREARYTEISGGERQLVLIARALTQQPKLLVMDEPTSNLDYGNQIGVLDHVLTLTERSDIGVIMTTHDPNIALRYGSRVVALGRGGKFCVGTPHQVVTEDYLFDTYGVRSQIIAVPRDGVVNDYLCFPQGRMRGAEPDAGRAS